MKRTVLDMVRSILNDMDSDDVNSINDTVESAQVASILRDCYFEMMSNRNWPHLKHLVNFEHSGDLSKPTHLKLPENMKEMEYFRYNKTKKEDGQFEMHEVRYCYPDEFLRISGSRNTYTQNVRLVTDYGGTEIVVHTNQAPRYWTSFDDRYLVCDGYDADVDDTLKANKTQALIVRDPQFILEDDAVPDLPSEAFSALLEEARSTAFFALKQMVNDKAEQKAGRQNRWLARKAWQAHGGVRYQDYGRRGRK